ncbi:MAG: YicC family protein [Sphingobacteriales bacterium]|nr:MAG: YicC family protein [Sphingobacteriales bacterium]
MLYSMTGFGRSEATVNGRHVVVEMKSLNGKQFDIVTKLPPILRSYELDIRTLLSNKLMRGTIDLMISIRQDGAAKPMVVNTDLAIFYYQSMQQISKKLGIQEDNILSTLMRMPEVVAADQDVLPEQDWLQVEKVLEEAATHLMEHRKNEGAALHKDLHQRIQNIEKLLEAILPLEAKRSDKIRSRISQSLQDAVGKDGIDPNRFEQEMIYYLERIDFSEEKTRLKQHCQYFYATVEKEGTSKGKILGFILQEIGREINTLGAKANQAEIQQLVISMKDELEKAKEQVLNIL